MRDRLTFCSFSTLTMQRSTLRLQQVTGHITGQPTASNFDHIQAAPKDAIFKTKSDFAADKDPRKMNLGVGAYRDGNGKPFPLKVVKEAERQILADTKLNKEYLPITGHVAYAKAAAKLVFADSVNLDNVASTQSISGTGALRLGAEFISKWMKGRTTYFSDPTWGNHFQVFKEAGVRTAKYTYWDPKKRELNINAMLNALKVAPSGSVVCLHACAHNPTGVDPTMEQWKQIAAVMKGNNLFPFFDSAYQGFASGDLSKDAWAIRYFASQGFELIVTQSFAKNLGLYNERVGCFHVVTQSAAKASDIKSQVAKIVRPMYSNPPAHGALIVHRVLTSPQLFAQWESEMKTMSGRILEMRHLLRDALVKKQTPGSWEHIVSQIGMFSYTGLSVAQCKVMKSKHHVYLLDSGRISMAGINKSNYQHLANAIDDVVRTVR